MRDIKEFWLDPNKKYTRHELREILKYVRPDDSFVVHYNGVRWTEYPGFKNVEKLIDRIVPNEIDVFTKDSSENIIPRLNSESNDSTRLKYGSEFKHKFVSECDFDQFMLKNLHQFVFNSLLPHNLENKYDWNVRPYRYTFISLDDPNYEAEKTQRKNDIIREYKITLEAYEVEEATKKQASDSTPASKYIPLYNFFISFLFHAIVLILYIAKLKKSTEYFWIFISAELCFAFLTVALFPDCYYDDDSIKINNRYARSYEIFMNIGVAISMILLIINFPQFFNIGGKFIVSFFKR